MSRLTPPKSSRRPGVACRSQDRRSAFRYVRQVRGRSGIWVWQARAWLPLPIGSVNLGCYREERIAWEVVKTWIRAGADPVRDLPAGVLPKWVRRERNAGGRPTGRFIAEFRSGSGRRDRLGVYKTPQEAFAAALSEARVRERAVPASVLEVRRTVGHRPEEHGQGPETELVIFGDGRSCWEIGSMRNC